MIEVKPILNLRGAEVSYGSRMVVRGVDLSLSPGEIYALLGPNGAGKSTLVQAICGRLKLTGGKVSLDDKDPWSTPSCRSLLGLVPQEIALYDHMTVRENLEVFGRLSGVKGPALQAAVSTAMGLTRVVDREHVPIRHLSGGYQRRVNIAAAILHQPRLLILDEPTVGVDLDAREAVDAVIRDLRDTGVAVLIVTHDLEQADGLADRVGFLREGKKVMEGPPRTLIKEAFGEDMEILVQLSEEAGVDDEALMLSAGLQRRGRTQLWSMLDAGGYATAGRIDSLLRQAGLAPREIRVREPSLQNLFTLVADWRRAA